MAGESGKIDPMYQFQIEPLAQLDIAGYDVSFTNSSLFMILVLGALWRDDLVPNWARWRWQATDHRGDQGSGVHASLDCIMRRTAIQRGVVYMSLALFV